MEQRKCFLCGANGELDPLEKHHIFGGFNRENSEKYNLTVFLCGNECHRNGKNSAHKNKEVAQKLHEYGQKKFEDENPDLDFIEKFGKNYLDRDFICPFAPMFRC